MTLKTSFILIRFGCGHCLEALRATNIINRHLSLFDQIEIKNNFDWEEFNFKIHPVMDSLDPKSFEGYPYIRIGGIELEPAPWDNLLISMAEILIDKLKFPVTVRQRTADGRIAVKTIG